MVRVRTIMKFRYMDQRQFQKITPWSNYIVISLLTERLILFRAYCQRIICCMKRLKLRMASPIYSRLDFIFSMLLAMMAGRPMLVVIYGPGSWPQKNGTGQLG